MSPTSGSGLLANRGAAAIDALALCTEPIRWEGHRREMYVDRRGNVSAGIGHPLAGVGAALALPWQHRSTGRRATSAEVRVAFRQVRSQALGHRAPAHLRASDLVLPAGFATELAAARLERTLLPGLRRLCPRFDRYPLPARRALVDMAWNLGLRELARFHNLTAACARGDFAAAADHCHRRGSHSARNVATRDLFRQAAVMTGSNTRATTDSGFQRILFPEFAGKNARFDGGRR
jgi:GH24 family phage-related lysozyme (muramidase)